METIKKFKESIYNMGLSNPEKIEEVIDKTTELILKHKRYQLNDLQFSNEICDLIKTSHPSFVISTLILLEYKDVLNSGDKTLMEIYMLGFEQELQGTFKNEYDKDSYESRAYELGGTHALYGDECKSLDYLSNEEILKTIRNI